MHLTLRESINTVKNTNMTNKTLSIILAIVAFASIYAAIMNITFALVVSAIILAMGLLALTYILWNWDE